MTNFDAWFVFWIWITELGLGLALAIDTFLSDFKATVEMYAYVNNAYWKVVSVLCILNID